MDFFTNLEIFKKYKKGIILILLSCIMLAVTAVIVIPKKYKSIGVLSISVKYFQNPLVREFVTETYDSNEMKTQREALIITALTDKFIDQIGTKYKLYDEKVVSNPVELYNQRNLLRDRIEVLQLNPSVSQISFFSKDPEISHEINELIFTRITEHFVAQRQKFLINLRASMKKRIDALIASIGYSVVLKDTDEDFSKNPRLSAEREKLKSEIADKLKFYNKSHPVVVNLDKQLAIIERELGESVAKLEPNASTKLSSKNKKQGQETPPPEIDKLNEELPANQNGQKFRERDDELLLSNSTNLIRSNNVVYEDLVRKFEYLNIAINSEDTDTSAYFNILQNPTYPTTYVSPNRAFFLMWGVVAGFLLACIYIAICESLQSKETKIKLKSGLINNTQIDSHAIDIESHFS
jgi:uncharacterized protein involved in exopolysaccharide biosynthesis